MAHRLLILCAASFFWMSCSTSQPRVAAQEGKAQKPGPQASVSSVQGLRSLAEQGNVEAQFNLGQAYDRGRGVPKDYVEALRWYRLAAAQGDPFAQFHLGNHYSEGIGLPKNEKEALRWWQLAAAQGFPPAQHSVGKVLSTGSQDVPSDKIQAYVWLALSSSQGNEEAIQERDAVSKQLTPDQFKKAKRLVNLWKPTRLSAVITKNSK